MGREQHELDTVLDALANTYRRRLLFALLEHNPQEADDALLEHNPQEADDALLEHNPQEADDAQLPAEVPIDDEDLNALRIQMTHVHLPKLEDTGLIEWDREANVVRIGPRFEAVRPLLRLMRDHADELPDNWI